VELPVSVGDFYTPEAAMERQRNFCQRERVWWFIVWFSRI